MTPQDPPPNPYGTGSNPPPPPPGGTPPGGAGATPPPGGAVPPGGYPPAGGNPPGGYPPGGNPPGGYPSGPTPPSGGSVDIGAGFSWAWSKFTENAAALILGWVLVGVLAMIPLFLGFIPVIKQSGDATTYDASTGAYTSTATISGGATFLAILGTILFFLVAYGLGANLYRMALMIADGAKPGLGELFKFPRGGGPILLALLIALGTTIGYLLCFIPGVLFSFGAAFAYLFFFDRNLGSIDSITASFKLYGQRFGSALVAVLLASLLLFVGQLLCGIGILLTGPIALLFLTNQYRQMVGGPIAP